MTTKWSSWSSRAVPRSAPASTEFADLGSRGTVFDGPPPPVVLVEPGLPIDVTGRDGALVVVGSAPGGGPADPPSAAASSSVAGIEDDATASSPAAARRAGGRLIAFEAFTPGGNWSNIALTRHRGPAPRAYLEEVYFYRFARPTGFAVQRVYTADGSLDETMTVRDGDLVLVPRGYHVVGTAVGYDCYYLNLMAGHGRDWRFTVDPDHAWLMDWDPGRPRPSGSES